ncbi:MAG: hypothetical protein A2V86_07295 [Deltaproteobacteria bacterium RBG_16_49_23]|nr:MAG: hypothetical protein A2V86_07295 [Deltaproteobacteria bacterium RBG_16_49_23]
MKTRTFLGQISLIPFIILLFSQFCFALTNEEIQKFQSLLKAQPVGERIAFWAERFVGTPYDPDPMGEYVTKAVIVGDERVDCMYLTFRAVELAFSRTPEEAVQIALEKRFRSKGILKDGKVVNYGDRFEYGEDMIFSGKWGEEITSQMGKTKRIKGSRGRDFVEILPSEHLLKDLRKLRSGDILFFIKKPEARRLEEIIGHIGVIKGEREVYLIHASGTKEKGGEVKKVLLKDYLSKINFVGVKITRFE